MNKNLYVGNLSFETTADDLLTAFTKYGTVICAELATDRATGRPRGFGFVEMSDGAEQAIAGMNGSQLKGRTLTVNESKPKETRPSSGSPGRRERH